jgi:hypothetical protein
MDTRHWDPSPATATGYRRRPKLHPAGAAAGTVKPDVARFPGTTVLGAQTAPPAMAVRPVKALPPGGFAPPVTAPTASRAPSHATSAAS